MKSKEDTNLGGKKVIEIKCKGADTLPIDRILEFQGELKELSKENEKKLRNSILKFGFIAPFFVWDDQGEWRLLDGHQRLKTLLKMREEGYDIPMLPVDYIEADSEEDAKRKLLHITSQYGEFTVDGFENFTFGLDEFEDIRLTNNEFVVDIYKEEIDVFEDDFNDEEVIDTDIKVGDLFQIGDHRLMCGDSTNNDMIRILMGGKKAELLFTSPPYSDMREYNGDKDLSISHLSTFIKEWRDFVNYQVVNLGIQRKDNEIIEYWNDYIKSARDCGYKLLSWNIWNREQTGTMAQQTAMFSILHEWLFVFGDKPKKLNRTIENKHHDGGKRKNKKVRQADGTQEETTSMFYDRKQIGTITTCLYETGVIRSLHPATFPVELPSEYIKAFTNKGDIIVDSFIGSGTTMVASHQLGRVCYGMELDPEYCQVVINRMKSLDDNISVTKITNG